MGNRHPGPGLASGKYHFLQVGTKGRAIRILPCWTERNFDLQIHFDEELENSNELALYVISRYYPLISGEEIVLPPSLGMHPRVKRRWIEEILPNRKCIV